MRNTFFWLMIIIVMAVFSLNPSIAKPAESSSDRVLRILKELDDLYRSSSAHGLMSMQVKTAHYTRSMRLESWASGKDKSLIRIIAPLKERGTSTLMYGKNIYTYLPKTDRTIRLTSGMMGGSWMGSHFTNDDLIKESRMSEDYDATITFEGIRNRQSVIEFTLIPKPLASVVWGKIVLTIEAKNIIVKIQAMFWMPLSILFLNFVYLFLKKQKDTLFYFFIISTITSTILAVFSNRILLGYQDFNVGTMAKTGPEFLIITFLFILPAAIYSLYLIGRAGNILLKDKPYEIYQDPYFLKQLRILFWGSTSCFIIAVSTNIFFDQVLGYSGELHLASLSLSIQSIFILPALIKYNFLSQPMETLGDELYLNSSDAVLITNEKGSIINLNSCTTNLVRCRNCCEFGICDSSTCMNISVDNYPRSDCSNTSI